MQASPSKARAEALEAQSWSIVLSWLTTLYHPSAVPHIERNPETLQALQSLMAENIAAEHIRDLVYAAQREEVAATSVPSCSHDTDHPRPQKADTNDAESLLHLLDTTLSPPASEALDSLAESAVLLGCPPTRPSSILRHLQLQILHLPRQTGALESQLSSIDTLMATLERQISYIQETLGDFSRESTDPYIESPPVSTTSLPPPLVSTSAFSPSSPSATAEAKLNAKLLSQTLQHQRETKQLSLKCDEYKSRIEALERQIAATRTLHGADGTILAEISAVQDSIRRKKAEASTLETRIRAFHGLPPDLEASRKEVRRAQAELDGLKGGRDGLFERMGEGNLD